MNLMGSRALKIEFQMLHLTLKIILEGLKELMVLKDAKLKNFTLLLDDMNQDLIDLYSIKCSDLFNVQDIQVENGYQEHTGRIFDNSILSIVISE